MEQFSDLIKNRRSMRKFTDQELTQEEVVALLKAALMAPSSKRSNCWQFLVVDDKDMLEKLSHCKEMGAAFLADAAMAVVVMADPLASDVWIEDAAIASIMIQLCLRWVSGLLLCSWVWLLRGMLNYDKAVEKCYIMQFVSLRCGGCAGVCG